MNNVKHLSFLALQVVNSRVKVFSSQAKKLAMAFTSRLIDNVLYIRCENLSRKKSV